jgi:hypothetical protein
LLVECAPAGACSHNNCTLIRPPASRSRRFVIDFSTKVTSLDRVRAGQATSKGSATMRMPQNLGMLLLAIWLILFGLLTAPFLKISFAYSGDLLAVLAIAAGIVLLLRR